MPRPSITMVFHRASRSTRVVAGSSDAASVGSAGDETKTKATTPDTSSPPLSHSDNSEKRIRKPSQKMLEALQDDGSDQSNGDKTAAPSAKGKPSRASPVAAQPTKGKRGRSGTGKVEPTADTATAIAESNTTETIPEESPVTLPAKKRKWNNVSPSKQTESKRVTRAQKHSVEEVASEEPAGSVAPQPPVAPATISPREIVSNRVAKLKISLKKDGQTKVSMASDADGEKESAPSSISPILGDILPSPSAVETVPPVKKTTKAEKKTEKAKKKAEVKLAKTAVTGEKNAKVNTEKMEKAAVCTDLSVVDVMEEPEVPLASVGFTPVTTERRLTARQRAKLYGAEDHLIKLEDPRPKTPPADYQEKREERNKKRREQAAQKREELKKETMKRLLHKSASTKIAKKDEETFAKKFVKYVMTEAGTTIFYPEGYAVMEPMLPLSGPPKTVLCGVKGCQNLKKYSSAKDGTPLCGLQCYKVHQLIV